MIEDLLEVLLNCFVMELRTRPPEVGACDTRPDLPLSVTFDVHVLKNRVSHYMLNPPLVDG